MPREYSYSVGQAVKLALWTSAITAAGLSTGVAQSSATEDDLEEVIVTGSRIARPEIEASTPVQIISAQDLQLQGAQNLADVLAKIPSVGTPTYSKSNTNFSTSANGVSTINLRNIEDKRSLVLINGRRVVSGVGGSTTVDLNNIPADLIESVQVVTGGASAVYGSEAVAGVVNFILKKDFEGVSAHIQHGMTSQRDNNRTLASITAGTAVGSGHVSLSYQYDSDNGLYSRDRKLSAVDQPFKSGYPPQGRFFSDNSFGDYTYNASNQLIQWTDNNTNGYNRNGDRYISVPLQRHLVTALGNFDLADDLGAYFEASYSKVKSNSGLEPFAADNSDARLPDGTVLAGLTLDNPYIPAAIVQDLTNVGDSTLYVLKRMSGVFDRSNRVTRDFYRGVAGLNGKLWSDWDWDVYFQQSQTKEDNRSETAYRDRLYYALDVVDGPNGPMCRDATARADGCAPFNPFGFNSVSSAAAAYITNNHTAFDTYQAQVRQQVAAFNVTGTAWALPAGDLKIASGLEWRKEQSSEVYSPETQAGNTLGNALTNTIGKYSVKEVYAESLVPLVKDMSWVKSWDAEAAIRVGDYSTVGNVLNWKLGTTFAPNSSLRFRAVYANASRAPNISELYQGPQQTFPTGLTDPCDGVTAATAGAVAAWCRSIPGVAQQIALNGVFAYDPNQDTQSIEGTDGSNPNLDAEVAKTWTLGLVFTPEFVPGLNVTVDYYSIKIRDAITFVPRQTVIDECANSLGTSSLCSLIVREVVGTPRPRTPGTIYQIDSIPVNAAEISTSGIDVGASYRFDNLPVGTLELGLQYSYLQKLDLKTSESAAVEHEKGQLSGDGRLGAGFPHRANISANYEVGPVQLNWRINYLSRMQDTLDENNPELGPEQNNIGSYVYHNMQIRYSLGSDKQYSAYVGMDNVFNKLPPIIPQNAASNITGTETAADSYDPIGRFIYAGITARF